MSELDELVKWGCAIAKRISDLTGKNVQFTVDDLNSKFASIGYVQEGITKLHPITCMRIGLDENNSGGIMIIGNEIVSDEQFCEIIGK